MASGKYVKKVDYGESAGPAFRVDIEDESGEVLFAKKHSRIEKCLFATVVVFVTVAIVFIVLYSTQVSKTRGGDSSATTQTNERSTWAPITSKTTACFEPHCILIASG